MMLREESELNTKKEITLCHPLSRDHVYQDFKLRKKVQFEDKFKFETSNDTRRSTRPGG